MAIIAFAIPIFETVEATGIPHCQEIGVSILNSLELLGLYFILKAPKKNRAETQMSWNEPLTYATGWGGAEIFFNNIMYFIWGNEADTKWTYLQEALNLNIVFLEVICVCVLIYAYSRNQASDTPTSPIGTFVTILLFRYLSPTLIKIFLKAPISIAARAGSAFVFYLIAKR